MKSFSRKPAKASNMFSQFPTDFILKKIHNRFNKKSKQRYFNFADSYFLIINIKTMGGWQLEVGKMAMYMAFPVGMFHYFNQPEYFEKWVRKNIRSLE